jgi:hypothetical protein
MVHKYISLKQHKDHNQATDQQLFIVSIIGVYNTTFNYMSAMSVLLVEETLIPGDNKQPAASHLQN